MNFIKSWNDRQIRIREDRYVCLTDMAQAVGKLFGGWNRLESTKNYLATLSSFIQIDATDLVQVIQGGDPQKQGTWGHPKVALRFAQWCSNEFAVQVDIWTSEKILESFEANPVSTSKSGFVYLARSGQTHWYKIGMSKNPYRRMTLLQVGSPLEIVLVHRTYTLDMTALEKALHEYYAAYQLRGEWFDLPVKCVREFPTVANELDTVLETAYLPSSKSNGTNQ